MKKESDPIGLEEAASIIGVHRATVNEMVRGSRIPGKMIGPHWFVERSVVEEFSRTYERPRNAPRRLPTNAAREKWTRELIVLINSWHSARVDELADFISLHPGNIRKYLNKAELDGLVHRDEFASWTLTPAGGQWLREHAPGDAELRLRSLSG
jgi:excisionase family DNA binding protein